MIEIEKRAQDALNELGEPGGETPAPIANAVTQLHAIIAAARAMKDPPKQVERRPMRRLGASVERDQGGTWQPVVLIDQSVDDDPKKLRSAAGRAFATAMKGLRFYTRPDAKSDKGMTAVELADAIETEMKPRPKGRSK